MKRRDKIQLIIKQLRAEKYKSVSPNIVNATAWDLNITDLTSQEVVNISDNYKGD